MGKFRLVILLGLSTLMNIAVQAQFSDNAQTRFPNNARAQFSNNALGQFPGNALTQFPDNTRTQFSNNAQTQFPANARAQFANNAPAQFSDNAQTPFPVNTQTQFPDNAQTQSPVIAQAQLPVSTQTQSTNAGQTRFVDNPQTQTPDNRIISPPPRIGFPKLEQVVTFEDFVRETGRVYANEEERQYRESIFTANKMLIDASNKAYAKGASTYQLVINPFADRTLLEMSKVHGSKISPMGEDLVGKHRNYARKNPIKGLPDRFDWRELGGVTSAKYQGEDCGSCWSFAVIGCLEGHLFRKTGFLVPLSAQDLVDCASSYGSMGCEGGFQEYGFEYIVEHGVALEARYPYTEKMDKQCHHNETGIGVQIRDYASIKPGDEERMKEVIATLGPIACSLNAGPNSFQLYKGGLYMDDECNMGEVNHSVVVVGYGSDNGQDFWIIKNSYSANWGEDGFMRLPRNKNGYCGIASECSYPVL